jgi:electron transfer flavoprotein beta subunit
MENALDVVKANLPLVVSVTSEINKPRRPPLTQILRASRKQLNVWTLSDLGITADIVGSVRSAVRVISNLAPAQERKGIIFEGDADQAVEKIVEALRKEGVIA